LGRVRGAPREGDCLGFEIEGVCQAGGCANRTGGYASICASDSDKGCPAIGTLARINVATPTSKNNFFFIGCILRQFKQSEAK